jgi:sugar/nucleoside kinase (ribokinase family)
MLTGAESDEVGCRLRARRGKLVVLKQGPRGSRVFCGDTDFEVASFSVTEADPTGAGDSFSAGFTWLCWKAWNCSRPRALSMRSARRP